MKTSATSSAAATLAGLVLAVLPVAALSTAAHAQGGPQRVHMSDINMSSTAGQAAFDSRVDRAARHLCATESNLTQKAACQAGVRQEAAEKAASNLQFASRN